MNSSATDISVVDNPSNRLVIFLVVGALVFLSIEVVSTNCWMSFIGKEPSRALDLLTGSLVGALTSMLVKTSPTQTLHATPIPAGTPPEVTVVNKPDDPIPTTETWNKI